MPYQSKTYSLSDEVIAAIEAARKRGLTPNKYLCGLIALSKATDAGEYTTLRTVIDRLDHGVYRKELTAERNQRGDRLVVEPEGYNDTAQLDAVGPELSSGRGKASTETYARRSKKR
jgi:hypothetical protein